MVEQNALSEALLRASTRELPAIEELHDSLSHLFRLLQAEAASAAKKPAVTSTLDQGDDTEELMWQR